MPDEIPFIFKGKLLFQSRGDATELKHTTTLFYFTDHYKETWPPKEMSHVFDLAQSVAETFDFKFCFGQTTAMSSSKRWPWKIHVWCCVCIILLFANVVSNILSPRFLYRSGALVKYFDITTVGMTFQHHYQKCVLHPF